MAGLDEAGQRAMTRVPCPGSSRWSGYRRRAPCARASSAGRSRRDPGASRRRRSRGRHRRSRSSRQSRLVADADGHGVWRQPCFRTLVSASWITRMSWSSARGGSDSSPSSDVTSVAGMPALVAVLLEVGLEALEEPAIRRGCLAQPEDRLADVAVGLLGEGRPGRQLRQRRPERRRAPAATRGRTIRRWVTPRIWARLSCISRAIRSRSATIAPWRSLSRIRALVMAIEARSDRVTRKRRSRSVNAGSRRDRARWRRAVPSGLRTWASRRRTDAGR